MPPKGTSFFEAAREASSNKDRHAPKVARDDKMYMQTQIIKKDLSTFPVTPNMTSYEEMKKTFSWEEGLQAVDYFSDGTMNIAYNAIDRHAKGAKKDKTALLFESANGEKEQYTFETLRILTNKFANVLDNQNIEK